MNGKRSKWMRSLKYLFVLSVMAVWYNFVGITAPIPNYYCANTQLFPCNEVACNGPTFSTCNPDCSTNIPQACNESLHFLGVWPACLNNGNPASFCDPALKQVICLIHLKGQQQCFYDEEDENCNISCDCTQDNGITLTSACI